MLNIVIRLILVATLVPLSFSNVNLSIIKPTERCKSLFKCQATKNSK